MTEKKNYHLMLTRQPDDTWKCDYCGASFTVIDKLPDGCTHEYETCEACGGCEESNECKPDCASVAAELSLEGEPEERAEEIRHALKVGRQIGAVAERNKICEWLDGMAFHADTPAFIVQSIVAGIKAEVHRK